jgi:lathosterol oxidase
MNDFLLHYSNPTYTLDFSGLIPEQPLLCEFLSTYCQTFVCAMVFYFSFCSLSYLYIYKIRKESLIPKLNGKFCILYDIKWSIIDTIFQSISFSLLRLAFPRYSFMYYDVNDYPLPYIPLSMLFHIIFDEFFTYWIHRFMHTYNFMYTKLHRIHHKSIDVTPFSSFAFHPLDTFAQSLPTFVTSFFFPLHFNIMIIFGILTSLWSISIHDNVPALPIKLFLYSSHHTIHHEKGIGRFRNYGKFTTVCDRIFGSYEDPDRIDLGWIRSEKTKRVFKRINEVIEKIIPDRTKRIALKRN